MYSVEEIRSWSTDRIRDEIADQKRWIREAEEEGSDMGLAQEYLARLRQVLDERR